MENIDYREDAIWKVYIHIVPKALSGYDHDKYYVGITSQPKVEERWGKDGYGYHTQNFYRAILKYGWNNLEHDVIAEGLTKQEAHTFEQFLIKELKANNKTYGYNKSDGGEGQQGLISIFRKDLTGKKFGKLTVKSLYDKKYYSMTSKGCLLWVCDCDCGAKNIIVLGSNLKKGNTKSCGKCYERPIKGNETIFNDSFVTLKANKNEFICDLEDYHSLNLCNYTWMVDKRNRVYTEFGRSTGNRTYLTLVNLILGFDGQSNLKLKINYKNGNRFDFRKHNLEIIIPSHANKREYMLFLQDNIKEIFWDNSRLRWITQLNNKKTKRFMSYDDAKRFFYAQKEENSMGTIYVGSARMGENGKITGGKDGDQKQKITNGHDYTGEVSQQKFYVHKSGWYILRPKSIDHANKLAAAMITECDNVAIGYNQNERNEVVKEGVDSKKKINADCSSSVRACIKKATGKDVGAFSTAGEADVLEKSGLFEKRVKFVSLEKTPVYNGDVLVTCVKGHTVIVTAGNPRKAPAPAKKAYTGTIPTKTLKKGSKGTDVTNLQKFLKWYGCDLGKHGVDGEFGDDTMAALKKFEKAQGLTVNGIWEAKDVTKAKAVKK